MGAFLDKFLYQTADIRPYAARIYPIVMVNVLDRNVREEVGHIAEFVSIKGNRSNRMVSRGAERKLDRLAIPLNPERVFRSTMALENIPEVCATFPSLMGILLQSLEFRQAAGYAEIRSPLAAIAACVSQRKIILRIQAIFRQWIDVVDIQLPLMQSEIDWIFTDEAGSRLPLPQSLL
ncbi:MAG TPA: hypothetical protein PLD73_13135 [Candidatus Hydrogenedentes bacterium]|nr:hypothetical protein [Candidatus Hydrogenedentota bacterium]